MAPLQLSLANALPHVPLPPAPQDVKQLKSLIQRHLKFTGSEVARRILLSWDRSRPHFKKVFPHEYARWVGERQAASACTCWPAAPAGLLHLPASCMGSAPAEPCQPSDLPVPQTACWD